MEWPHHLRAVSPLESPGLSVEAVRAVDRRAVEDYGLSSLVLMENAGRGVADVLCLEGIAGPVLICCGKGNNAGDGLVLARHLDLRGYPVTVVHWNDPNDWRGDTQTNYQVALKARIELVSLRSSASQEQLQQYLRRSDWVVDALLGTGVQGAPRSPIAGAIRQINATKSARILAVDLPSGLDGDTGHPQEPTVRADVTCTFVAIKRGFQLPGAAPYLGRVFVLDIGTPRHLLLSVLPST